MVSINDSLMSHHNYTGTVNYADAVKLIWW